MKKISYLEFEQKHIWIIWISPYGRNVQFAGEPEADIASGFRRSGLPEDHRRR